MTGPMQDVLKQLREAKQSDQPHVVLAYPEVDNRTLTYLFDRSGFSQQIETGSSTTPLRLGDCEHWHSLSNRQTVATEFARAAIRDRVTCDLPVKGCLLH